MNLCIHCQQIIQDEDTFAYKSPTGDFHEACYWLMMEDMFDTVDDYEEI